jgi:L-aminoadipate-semialdehyde dehydrogenase
MDFLDKLGINKINSGAFSGAGWTSTHEGRLIESVCPATNEVISAVHTCNQSDYDTVLTRAQHAHLIWRDVPAPKRGEIIRQIGNALRDLKSELGSLVSLEMGKSKQEGDGEVQEMIDIADFAVGQSRMLYGNSMHSERFHHRMYEQWHPYGIVGIISAFNFPVAVWAWNAFLAAICGNISLWKPSSKTPLCAIAVQNICNKVLTENNCPEIFSLIIPEDRKTNDIFIDDGRIPLISFTGSTKTGKHVSQVVASRLGNTILELGGNNAIIVDETADLNIAIPAIVFGAVGTCGQRCTSTRRLIVHQSIYDDVLKRLHHAYEQVTIGDPLDEKNLMGPLIDETSVNQYLSAIERIKNAGGKVLFGGNRIEGNYVEPAIISDVENDWDIVQEETFAPILYVMKYTTFENAITLQNSVPQGLSSALFTTNIKHSEHYLSALGSDCGIANINIGTSGAEIGGAFGGEKETGGGRESGSDAWKAYMRRQTNTINWSDELPLAQGITFNLE